jgi:hypothetical protein
MAPTKLRSLAILTRPGGRFAGMPAFTAITILHHGLPRLGFEIERRGLMWPRLTAAYQRALLASLHPGGATRTLRLTTGRAERLWISSRTLRALDAAPARRVA